MQAIKQINLEKDAMDRMDGNSSYCGSVRELNIIGTELNGEHKPTDSISQNKYKSKKRRKKNKKNKSKSGNNNLSIWVEPPSIYNEYWNYEW